MSDKFDELAQQWAELFITPEGPAALAAELRSVAVEEAEACAQICREYGDGYHAKYTDDEEGSTTEAYHEGHVDAARFIGESLLRRHGR